MTRSERNAVRSLAAARAGLSLERESHLPHLVTESRKALLAGEGLEAWLLADRLCRITGGREALPFLLRAGALAILGEAKAADQDLAAAAELNPEHPLVIEAMLAGADPDRRRAAAMLAAGLPDAPESAYRILAASGITHLIRLDARNDRLEMVAIWAGEPAFTLALLPGAGGREEPIRAQGVGPGGYPHTARLEIPWPARGQPVRARVNLIDPDHALVFPPLLFPEAEAPRENWRGPGPAGILVVLPVYGDAEATGLSLDALFASLEAAPPTRIVIVDDASPDPAIVALVSALAETGRVTLLRNEINLGFAASVNAGLGLREAGEDALVLNADAFLPARALARLRGVVHAHRDVGTATPFSNNGEDTSIPGRLQANILPSPHECAFIDQLAEAANGLDAVDVPNGVGFCLYIRGDVLDTIGGFSARFERGYYEDVDFCLRARQAGYRNVCATGVYVGHAGSRSFGAAKRALVRRNLARLTARYPDYRAESQRFLNEDPLIPALARIEEAFLAALAPPRLVLAPANLPAPILAPFLAHLPSGQLATLVLGVAETDQGLECSLRGFGGAFPVGLAFTIPVGADPLPALAARLPAGLGELLLIDPGRIPPALGQAIAKMTTRIAIAVSDQEALDARPLAWLPKGAPVTLAAPALASLAQGTFPDRMLQVLKRPALPAEPLAPLAGAQRVLAILPQALDARERLFARFVADQLQRVECGAVLIGEGTLADMTGSPLWITGTLPRDQIAYWMRRLGIVACLLPSRRYAASDPAGDMLAAKGFALARWSEALAPAPHLDLSRALPDEAAAEAIAGWFSALVPKQATTAR